MSKGGTGSWENEVELLFFFFFSAAMEERERDREMCVGFLRILTCFVCFVFALLC
jgi:hypothetical protein